jgi:putative transposase
MTQCRPRHRHQDQEFLGFLRQIEKYVPEDLDLHLIVDNTCTHKPTKVRAWLAQRPRFHAHYTPTHASWLNQVERWFGVSTQRAIRRGSFSSVLAGGIRAAVGPDCQDRAVRDGLQQDQGAV